MWPFNKKEKSRDDIIAEAAQVNEDDMAGEKKEDDGLSDSKLGIEIQKIKGKLEALSEGRDANNERFSRISEQIGELRGMMTDLSKTVSKVEIGASKAVDLVESVQPEKLMIEVRKVEGKTEALKAGIDSNDVRMSDMLGEMKEMREKINFFKGVEQVVNLNEEMKKELAEMKKMQVTIERHSDKVENMFVEINRKVQEFDQFKDEVKTMVKGNRKLESDFDKLRVKTENKADKKEFTKLVDKYEDFEKHTGNLIELLDEKSKHIKQEIEANFDHMKEQLEKKFDTELEVKGISDEPEKEEAKKSLLQNFKEKIGKKSGSEKDKK